MTPNKSDSGGLRKAILKASLVRSFVQRWEKAPGEPIKSSSQEVVEIGIDDLMSLVTAHIQAVGNAVTGEPSNDPDINVEDPHEFDYCSGKLDLLTEQRQRLAQYLGKDKE